MKNVTKNIIVRFSIFILLLSSVLQFHHHDSIGNICINLSVFYDLVLEFSYSDNTNYSHECNQENHDHSHHSHNEDACSMHIAEYKISKECNIYAFNIYADIISDYVSAKLFSVDENNENTINYENYYPLKFLYYSVISFRAPPIPLLFSL